MSEDERDFLAEVRGLLGLAGEGELATLVRARVQAGELDDRVIDAALERIRDAEDQQRRLASWASGPGEGLAAIRTRRALQLARAWLLIAAAPDDARALCDEIAADGDGVHPSLRPDLAALVARLDQGRAT